MRGFVIAIPLFMFFGFIPFGILMEELLGESLLFFCFMFLYVLLFPLSPIIAAGLIGDKREVRIDSELNDARESSGHNGESGAVGWWNSDMTENDGYQ